MLAETLLCYNYFESRKKGFYLIYNSNNILRKNTLSGAPQLCKEYPTSNNHINYKTLLKLVKN